MNLTKNNKSAGRSIDNAVYEAVDSSVISSVYDAVDNDVNWFVFDDVMAHR